MFRFLGTGFAVLLLVSTLSGMAGAEITLPVNDNNTGIFDQPSVAMNGSEAMVAYIGDTGTGRYKVYYAKVNGGSNFANLSLVKDSAVMLTSPTLVDNAATGEYYDARHPKIAMRSSTEAVILFQAIPTSDNTLYQPYIARLTLSGNTVTSISVKKVGFLSGDFAATDIEDLSFGIVTSDNTARIAFGKRLDIGDPYNVYFARVGLDNATVVGDPKLLSLSGALYWQPLPSLRLDTSNRSHVAWAGNDVSGVSPVYYAMVKETNGFDNVVISATQVLAGGFRWGFPSVQVSNNSSIAVIAADESVPNQPGNMGFVNFNPDNDNQDGGPVQVTENNKFFITPPGELILPDEFNLYRPEVVLDPGGRFHLAGYGVGGTHCTFYAFQIQSTSPFYQILTPRAQAGFGSLEYPGSITGDYTRAAFGFTSGKAIVFWSGIVVSGGGNRNLDVSTVSTTTWVPFKESGCSMVSDPGAGDPWRMAGTAFLFLPAVVIAIRRIFFASR